MELVNPNFTIWHKGDYPEGTVGYLVFPHQLDQRLRLADALNHPAISFLRGRVDYRVLSREGIATSSDLLKMNSDKLRELMEDKLQYRQRLLDELSELLLNTLRSPFDNLMGRAFRRSNIDDVLVPPDMEGDRKLAIQRAVGQLNERDGKIIDYRFGLTDWSPKRIDVIAAELGIIRSRVIPREKQALNQLAHQPKLARLLRPFLPPLG